MQLENLHQLYINEQSLHERYNFIAGIDEAGRGPIAGPVVIAAVILDFKHPISGINDSKKLSSRKREELFPQITQQAIDFAVVEISSAQIDKVNILQAVLEGMREAINALSVKPELCLIDGNILPSGLSFPAQACVKGDAIYASIAAASILAKVTRDKIMLEQDAVFPQYGFARHKGYPTSQHLQALKIYGPCPLHRFSYQPVKDSIRLFSGKKDTDKKKSNISGILSPETN
ncbi:MAG: ribonuclease HII [Candidatus Cloacimonadaceae bacterium]